MKEKIVLWGDSIGKGVIFSEVRRRYCLAKDRCVNLLRAEGYTIEDNARMGATITEGFEEFTAAPAEAGDVVVIEYGGNDCDIDWDAVAGEPEIFHDGKTPLPLFRDTLRRFITEIRRRCQKPVAVIPPPLEAGRYFRWIARGRNAGKILDYLSDVQHIYRWHERYANAVREAAQDQACPLLDLRMPFLDARDLRALMCEDGIHPNEDGQRLMAQAVLRQISGCRPQHPAALPAAV